jgi:hypothetical protein
MTQSQLVSELGQLRLTSIPGKEESTLDAHNQPLDPAE